MIPDWLSCALGVGRVGRRVQQGLFEAARTKTRRPAMFKCLRVLIGMKQGSEEVLGLGERSLDVREEEMRRRACGVWARRRGRQTRR